MVMPFIGLWNLLVMPAGRDGTFAGRGGTFATGVLWKCFRVRWRLVVKMQFFACFFAASIWIGKFESPTYHFPIFFLWTHQELDGSKAKKSERIIFERIIVVKVERGDVPCLDLVDLPGLVKLPKDKVPLAVGMEMLTWQDSKLFTPKRQKMKNWTTTIIAVAFKLSLMLKSFECSWIGNSWCIFFASEAEQVNKIYERQLQEDRSNGNQCMYLAVVPASGQARPNTNPVMEFIMEKGLQAWMVKLP